MRPRQYQKPIHRPCIETGPPYLHQMLNSKQALCLDLLQFQFLNYVFSLVPFGKCNKKDLLIYLMKKPSVAAEGLSMRVLLEPETMPIGSITLQST